MLADNKDGVGVVSAETELTKASKRPNRTITFDKRKTTTPVAASANSVLETAVALMFPETIGQHAVSLLPASQFPQKKVGVVTRAVDVVHDDRAAHLTGVVDDDVAKAHQPLRNTRRDRDVLDFA